VKFRQGFVSNSSSASFTLMLTDLTAEQVEAIKKATLDQKTLCEGFVIGWLDGVDDAWDILFSENKITGNAICCNGCIWDFFSKLGIPRKIVSFYDDSDGPWEDDDEE